MLSVREISCVGNTLTHILLLIFSQCACHVLIKLVLKSLEIMILFNGGILFFWLYQ